jgi:hypothetical protein
VSLWSHMRQIHPSTVVVSTIKFLQTRPPDFLRGGTWGCKYVKCTALMVCFRVLGAGGVKWFEEEGWWKRSS